MTTHMTDRERMLQQLASTVTDAACEGMSAQWTAWEVAVRRATSDTAVARAADPALAICETCPLNHLGSTCSMLARHGRYTGLAAGRVWVNGEPRPTARRIPGPLPAVLRAS